ncbi:vesicular GABA transporter-like [Apostichopus japonicus]|uniref:vesicular GABA transporter-like n=1 Tax=Stichopus japonicus TaxID=307972 RepID=UPI003AB8575E
MDRRNSKEDLIPLLPNDQDRDKNSNKLEEKDHNDRGNQHEELSSNWQAGWNIINGQQGASLLGAPFAVGVGGFWSLIPLTLIALIGNYSSKILIQCLFEDEQEDEREEQDGKQNGGGLQLDREEICGRVRRPRKVRHSYMEVANDCFRGCGIFVRLAVLLSAFSVATLHLQTMGAIIIDMTDEFLALSREAVLLMCVVVSLGFVLSSNLTQLSFLSLLALICLILLTVGIDIVSAINYNDWYVEFLTKFSIYKIVYATSIIVFNFSAQFFIIDVHNSIADQTSFDSVVNVSSILAFFLFFAVSLPACLSFGPTIQEFVILSIPPGIFRTITCTAFLLKSYFSFPLAIFICELYFPRCPFPLPESFSHFLDEFSNIFTCLRRVMLMLISCVVAICIPSYAFILYAIGGTIMAFTEIIFPPLFHILLKKLTVTQKIADILIIVYGVGIAISTIIFVIQIIITGKQ